MYRSFCDRRYPTVRFHKIFIITSFNLVFFYYFSGRPDLSKPAFASQNPGWNDKSIFCWNFCTKLDPSPLPYVIRSWRAIRALRTAHGWGASECTWLRVKPRFCTGCGTWAFLAFRFVYFIIENQINNISLIHLIFENCHLVKVSVSKITSLIPFLFRSLTPFSIVLFQMVELLITICCHYSDPSLFLLRCIV